MARTNSAAKKNDPGATDRSFYPTPSANQPFDLSLEDFLSPQQLNVQNIKMKPALDNETEMGLIDTAMRDHGQMMTLLRQKKDQLEHALKYWNDAGKRNAGPNSMQSTVDALMMMSDTSSIFDLLDATFSKGYKINELSLS